MVIFDFEVSSESLAEAKGTDLADYPVAALAHTFFLMPVRLAIDGTELFHTETGIFYMASALPTVRMLPEVGSVRLNPPGMGLFMWMDGEDALMRIIGFGEPARAAYSDLLQAWEAFADKVRKLRVIEFPELRRHPRAGAWFRGKSYRPERLN
jgi:hypothetical protein